MISELVLCGASLPDGICDGVEPPEAWRKTINEVFDEQYDGNYHFLPRVEHEGTDDEEDHCEDGTYREMPIPISVGEYTVKGAIICTSCYVTLCMLSESGRGETHELRRAIDRAREMDPSELPRLGVRT
jgi:hypothetical protein